MGFFGSDTKSKNKSVGSHQTIKFLHRKRKRQSEKETFGTGENICKPDFEEGLIPKMHEEPTQLNHKNNNNNSDSI